MNRVVPELTDVHHIKLCYSKDTYCGHPRQCPIHNYGNGEIVVIHHHAPATYQTRENIRHGHAGYKGRAKILLQRSLDHGQTWLHENDVAIWDDSRPLEEKRAILWQADEPGVTREQIDLASPDAAIYFTRPQTGPAELQCYMLNIGGLRNAIQMAYSDDGGYSWTEPKPIVAWGQSPWAARRQPNVARSGVHYRSPWPMRLCDGRIVVIFGRRKPPTGIGLLVSEDDGVTWSAEAIIRDDGSGGDLSYPVATQLEDGRIFTAYYFMEDDGRKFGGTRHIAGSFFRL